MKLFRFTYTMEVFIEAKTQEDAQLVFDDTRLDELQPSFVSQDLTEEV